MRPFSKFAYEREAQGDTERRVVTPAHGRELHHSAVEFGKRSIFLIAGEESGDIHAAILVKQLKQTYPALQITGVGGQHMQNAGMELISDLTRYSVTGVTEVFKHAMVFKKAFKTVKQHLTEKKPDLLILVDYPAFNLRIAKFAKKVLGLRIVYYISPQIWAWKPKRIELIKACVDKMAVILPFEKKIYEQGNVPVRFVGHPLTETIKPAADKNVLRKRLGLPINKRLLAMLPGSRMNEIERHMPVLRDTAQILCKQYPDLHIVIPVAGSIKQETISRFFTNSDIPVSLIAGLAMEVMDCSDIVAVASGTASLECALLEKPMCIFYKVSWFTYMCAVFFMRVTYLGLCNLLAESMIVPELLQDDCNATSLAECLALLIEDEEQAKKMRKRLALLKSNLSLEMSDCSIFDLVVDEINLPRL